MVGGGRTWRQAREARQVVILANKLQADAIAMEACLRVRARQAAGPTPEDVAYQADELEHCRTDYLHWIDRYCWTFDPRLPVGAQDLPFHLYDYQRRYISWLEERYRDRQDGLTEKSRDVGVTWCNLAWQVHHWRFDGAFQALLGSRKEDLVDNWQIDSLFGRLEFIIERLPGWMKPAGYDGTKHRRHLKIVNPESGAVLQGESSNKSFGRGSRWNVAYLDEFAFWPDTSTVWAGTADSAPCRLAVSTPNPYDASGLEFEHLRDSGKVQVYTVHWRQHPGKDEAWLELEKTRRTDEEIAVELEISYQVALSGRVYPEWDKVPHGAYPYVAGWPLYCAWDYGLDDDTALVWVQRNPATGKFRFVDCYANSQRTIDFYVPWSTGQVASGLPYGYSEADLEQIGRHASWPGATHFGDPAGKQRNQVTGTSVIRELSLAGIHVNTKPETNTFEARHRETQMFLRQVEGVNMPACQALDDAMRHARYPKRGERTAEVSAPIHDWTAHMRACCEYMAVNAPKAVGVAQVKTPRRKSAWESM